MQEERTIKDLRQAVDDALKQLHYSDHSLAKSHATWNRLEHYAADCGTEMYSLDLAENFLRKVYGISFECAYPRQHYDRVRAVQMLTDYYLHGAVLIKLRKRKHHYPAQFRDDIASYINTKVQNGISKSRLHQMNVALEYFTEYLNGQGFKSVAEITPANMGKFIATTITLSECTRVNYYCIIRKFLVFCHETKRIQRDLSTSLPTGRYKSEDRIPSVYTDDEIQRLLSCIDRENPIGKRSYAIIILVVRLGLRAGDICRLRFENVLWESSVIDIIQEKTKIPVVLPLLEGLSHY